MNDLALGALYVYMFDVRARTFQSNQLTATEKKPKSPQNMLNMPITMIIILMKSTWNLRRQMHIFHMSVSINCDLNPVSIAKW